MEAVLVAQGALLLRLQDAEQKSMLAKARTAFETAERHYVHAQGIEAGRDYAAVLRRMRKERRS